MTAILIPARMESSRFPGKPLAKILGKPMIQWVYEGIKSSKLSGFKAVITDSPQIAKAIGDIGGKAFIVRGDFKSGTDRIAEFCKDKNFDYIVNVQGDEPLIKGNELDKLINFSIKHSVDMATFVATCNQDEINNPNVVKVVTDRSGKALYFSRAVIPYSKTKFSGYKKHVGVYLYSKETLLKLSSTPPGTLEETEKLEQLRALETGIPIYTLSTELTLIGVDQPGDVLKVESILKRRINNA